MADNPEPDSDHKKPTPLIGAELAIGAGVGAALFAATDSPVWIGVGAAVGAAVGAGIDQQRRRGD